MTDACTRRGALVDGALASSVRGAGGNDCTCTEAGRGAGKGSHSEGLGISSTSALGASLLMSCRLGIDRVEQVIVFLQEFDNLFLV